MRRIGKKKYTSIPPSGTFTYVLLIYIFFVLVACTPNASRQEAPRAVKGQLDLTRWNFVTDGPVKLSGEWEFYWEKLLDANEKPSREPQEGATFIRVPGTWNGHDVGAMKIDGNGFATYRLKVLLKRPASLWPSNFSPWALRSICMQTEDR
jgi:hypothetical protein